MVWGGTVVVPAFPVVGSKVAVVPCTCDFAAVADVGLFFGLEEIFSEFV